MDNGECRSPPDRDSSEGRVVAEADGEEDEETSVQTDRSEGESGDEDVEALQLARLGKWETETDCECLGGGDETAEEVAEGPEGVSDHVEGEGSADAAEEEIR